MIHDQEQFISCFWEGSVVFLGLEQRCSEVCSPGTVSSTNDLFTGKALCSSPHALSQIQSLFKALCLPWMMLSRFGKPLQVPPAAAGSPGAAALRHSVPPCSNGCVSCCDSPAFCSCSSTLPAPRNPSQGNILTLGILPFQQLFHLGSFFVPGRGKIPLLLLLSVMCGLLQQLPYIIALFYTYYKIYHQIYSKCLEAPLVYGQIFTPHEGKIIHQVVFFFLFQRYIFHYSPLLH